MKTSPGQNVRSTPLYRSDFINGLVDVVDAHKRRPARDTTIRGSVPSDLVNVKNMTEAVLKRGHAVQLGDYLLDPLNFRKLWFEADLPADPIASKIAIMREACPATEEIKVAQMSGVCTAWINVTDTDHEFCTPVDGSAVLKSSWCGMLEIMSPATSTGEQELPVRFLNAPVWELAKANSEISAASGNTFGTGQADIWYMNRSTHVIAASSPLVTVDVVNADETAIEDEALVLLQPFQHTGEFLAFPLRCA